MTHYLFFLIYFFIISCSSQQVTKSERNKTCQSKPLSLANEKECNPDSKLVCDEYIYSPDLIESKSDIRELCKSVGSSQYCTALTSHKYSTNTLRAHEPAEFFLPGGAFNFVEASCVALDSGENKIVATKGKNIDEAYLKILELCKR
ncbi:MAG: hypothetical protein KBD78_08875 [Oligoflexales bacterium]|nr:hypothetical protein [Oligoflexales bacterium]